MMDRFNRQAWRVKDAQEAVLSHAARTGTERLSLLGAIGRRLAEDVRTREPIPHFRRSGMDGYAVQSADLARITSDQPILLEVIAEIPAGTSPGCVIAPGQCAKIMTGGMVPEGADTVVMQEMTETEQVAERTHIRIRKPVSGGTNITRIGEEADAGDVLLQAGQEIGAGQAAILASLGYDSVEVYRKPKVAILSTGSELLAVTDALEPGKIRNSNVYMLAAQVQSAGAQPVMIESLPDSPEQIGLKLDELLGSDVDLVVTTGGVSVGDYDVMAGYFVSWQGQTLFNKIAMRPGSPTSVGVYNGKLLFGLSGNPSASFVGFELFVRPLLRRMQGDVGERKVQEAMLQHDYPKVNGFTRYVRGERIYRGAMVYAAPVGLDKSSAFVSLKEADCLIVIPPTKTGLAAGEIVEIIPLEG